MPARFRKKVRRQRGSHTHGWGAKKKHRGGGSRGGRGMAGLRGIKKSRMLVYMPEHFEKRGFKVPLAVKRAKAMRGINLKDLDILAEKKGLEEIDVRDFGFQKVLGTGKLSRKLVVKAEKITEKAIAKIEAMGGKAISEKK